MNRALRKQGIYSRQRIYDFLVDYITENGYPPSIREICAGVNLSSKSSVYNDLRMLEMLGKIEIKHGTPRAIRLVGYKFVKVEETV